MNLCASALAHTFVNSVKVARCRDADLEVENASVHAAGAKGKRYALDHTSIMLHHPSGTAGGQADDVHNEGRELLRLRDYMDATLSVATGRSFEAIQSDLERVLYMSTRDAVEYGVIDHVIKMNPKKLESADGAVITCVVGEWEAAGLVI